MKKPLILGLLALSFVLSLQACKKNDLHPEHAGQKIAAPTGDTISPVSVKKDYVLTADSSAARTYAGYRKFIYIGLVNAANTIYAFESSSPGDYQAYKLTAAGRTPVKLLFDGTNAQVMTVCTDNTNVYYTIKQPDSARTYVGMLSPTGVNTVLTSYVSAGKNIGVNAMAYVDGTIWWMNVDLVPKPYSTDVMAEQKLFFHKLSDATNTATIYKSMHGDYYYQTLFQYGTALAMIGKNTSPNNPSAIVVDKDEKAIAMTIGSTGQFQNVGDSSIYQFDFMTAGKVLSKQTFGKDITSVGQIMTQPIGAVIVIPSSHGDIIMLGKQNDNNPAPSIQQDKTGAVVTGSMILEHSGTLKTVSNLNFYLGEAQLTTCEDKDGIWFANLSLSGNQNNIQYFRWTAK